MKQDSPEFREAMSRAGLERAGTLARNLKIVERINSGELPMDLVLEYGLSRERIRQIFTKITGKKLNDKTKKKKIKKN